MKSLDMPRLSMKKEFKGILRSYRCFCVTEAHTVSEYILTAFADVGDSFNIFLRALKRKLGMKTVVSACFVIIIYGSDFHFFPICDFSSEYF